MAGRPWAVTAGGVVLAVRLTPRGGRDAIGGVEAAAAGRQPLLHVRVRAGAIDGAANEAMLGLIARAVGVPMRAVTLVAGRTSRFKRLKIVGDAVALAAALEKICSAG